MKNIINQFKNINIDKTFFYSLILFAFTMPLSRAAISFFGIFFIILYLVEGNFREKFIFIKNSSALKGILLFILFESLTFFYSQDQAQAVKVLQDYFFWLPILALSYKIKKEHIQPIITSFLFGMFVSEILAYIIFFDIYPINGRTPDYPSPFMFHIDYSVFLAFTSILLLNRLFSKTYTNKEKFLILIFFCTVTLNLFISVGRTGQLAYLIALFILTILHYKISLKSLFVFISLSFLLFFSAYKTLPIFETRINMAKSDLTQLFRGNFDTSWGLRAAFWIITYDALKENPLFGSGIGDYSLEASKILASATENTQQFSPTTRSWCTSHHYHNQYLMILVQSGIIGLILMFYMFYTLFKTKIEDKELNDLKIVFLTIFLVSFIAEPLWLKQFTTALFVLYVSLFISQKN